MQPLTAAAIDPAGREQSFIVDLAGGVATAMVDREPNYRGDAVRPIAQRFERFDQACPEGTDYASAHDSDTSISYGLIDKCHAEGGLKGFEDSC
jgi:hypothetical protein